MTITNEQIAEIAEGLTKAQARVLTSGTAPNGSGKWVVQNALIDKGLASYFPFRFTPTGLAVRDYLERNPTP